MTEDKRCDSVFSPLKGVAYRCELYDGHDGPHRWCIDWHEEDAGDTLE